MNYIYDILLNFNNIPYDIFEWNKDDKILHIRKIPLIKLSTFDLSNLVNKKVKIDNEFLIKIYKRTEQYNKKVLDYSFLATDGKMVIAFKIEQNKIKYSQLFLDEEMEVLDFSSNLNVSSIKYQIINDKKIDYLQTRNQQYIKKFIYNQLKKINDVDKLNFLYLECFNKKSNNTLKDIYYELDHNFENVYIKLYKVLKMTLIKR